MGCLLDMKLTARFEPWGYIHDLSGNICKRLQGKKYIERNYNNDISQYK